MPNTDKFRIPAEEKRAIIADFTPKMTTLRTKAGISQEDLASIIGVSRQTYGAMERGTQRLTWGTFLSLILFYDYNLTTRELLRSLTTFPKRLYSVLNDITSVREITIPALFGDESGNLFNALDADAIHVIKTVIMLEYARCTSTPGNDVVRAFDGMTLRFAPSEKDIAVKKALKEIDSRDE